GVQAAAIRHEGGEFWGVQYHPEFDLREIGRIIRRYGDTMIAEGFFSDRPALEAWAAELEALQDDPSRRDLAWKHGLDADVLDPERRLAEPRNWLERRVFAD
ncbi:MAG TPA: type 1 glutamine amidotransferase, partial [Alphaproteobacteria bacterium]|nr:type 1 glutamine amidotransferase [Alphaproteobacteria bacterium]